MTDKQYEALMRSYYKVLNNSWRDQVAATSRQAIRDLIALRETGNLNDTNLDAWNGNVSARLGPDFSRKVYDSTLYYIGESVKAGLQDAQGDYRSNLAIGLYNSYDQQAARQMAQQTDFYIGNKYESGWSAKMQNAITQSIEQGLTNSQFAKVLQTEFADMVNKSASYWQGLAEHTSLKNRMIGRLNGYEKAGAYGYTLVNPMDDRTSPICRALVGAGKIYPLGPALQIRNELLNFRMDPGDVEGNKEALKRITPFAQEKNVIYDSQVNPIGVRGSFTPFPPFHWKCRTKTQMVYEKIMKMNWLFVKVNPTIKH